MKTHLKPVTTAFVLLSASINSYSAPTAPELSFLNYSDTAAELFWTRATSDSGGVNYTVTRNGEIVFSGDALSFFDDSLEDGVHYNYSLVVSDSTGATAPAVGVSFSSSDDTIASGILSAPTGVRASVYSSSSLELFWDRVSSQALTYEIFQNGVSLGSTDGTSFYISSNVQRGLQYKFEVVAQLGDKVNVQYSAPTVLNVSLDADVNTAMPSEPGNASIQRYSRTTAELFWGRAAAEEQVVSTEVYRNSELLGTTQGTSFLDTSRSDELSYLYTLVSVNANGMRSGETQVSEELATEFVVNNDNINDVLNFIAALVNGTPFDSMVQTASDIALGSAEGLERISEEQGASFRVLNSTYNCDPTGTLVRRTISTLGVVNLATATNCEINGLSYSGDIERQDDSTTIVDITDFILLNDANAGARLNAYASTVGGGSIDVRSLSSSSYEEFDSSGMVSTSISNHNTTVVGQNLTTSFTANIEGYPEFTATTLTDFNPVLGREDNFATGSLQVVFADNGPTLTIDADNGDPASFSVMVDANESTTSYTVAWTLVNRYFLAFGL